MSKNAISTIPKEIKYLTKLIYIDFSHNRIELLPPEFFEFPNLKHLNLSDNALKELHPSVSDLNMLEFLVSKMLLFSNCFIRIKKYNLVSVTNHVNTKSLIINV